VDPKTAQSLNDFFAAAAIIAGIAAIMAIPSFLLLRRAGLRICPRWMSPGVPWLSAVLLLGLFPVALLGHQIAVAASTLFVQQGHLPPSWRTSTDDPEATKQLQQIWAVILTGPLFIAVYAVLRRYALAGSGFVQRPSVGRFARNVFLGICGWAVLMPLTFTVHFAVLQLFQLLGIGEQQHPLMALRPQDDGTGGILFAIAVCGFTPVIEECLFRGFLVPWAGQRRFAPWILMAAALLLAGMTASTPVYPLAFIAVLCGLLIALPTITPRKRFPRRILAGILSSSAVFAAVHSAVWPTPIPLFVLACGLGYLTARTRSIVPAVVVHGLFNAVSFAMLCRGSAI